MRAVLLVLASGCIVLPSAGTDPTVGTLAAATAPISNAVPWDCGIQTLASPALTCAVPADPALISSCAGHAALHLGVGYPSVDLAIVLASPGDTVTVCPGSWPGPVRVDRELVLQAADPAPGVTVIDGGGATRGLSIEAPATVIGLTVRNGAAPGPGGVLVDAPGVTLECMTLEDNRGGAVAARAGDLVVRTSTFSGNGGPGLYEGGALVASAGLLVEDSVFLDNVARYAGGAVAARGDTTIRRSFFRGNQANYEGGALEWGDWDPFQLALEDSVFVCNSAGYEGGAVDLGTWADDLATISGSTFAGNKADNGAGAIECGSWGRSIWRSRSRASSATPASGRAGRSRSAAGSSGAWSPPSSGRPSRTTSRRAAAAGRSASGRGSRSGS